MHVAGWIEFEGRTKSAPSVKQRLAAIRHLFDCLVTGHIVDVNPEASVRGPRHVVRSVKTPALDSAEAPRDGSPPQAGAAGVAGLALAESCRTARRAGGRVGRPCCVPSIERESSRARAAPDLERAKAVPME
jgi:hypothetical protein